MVPLQEARCILDDMKPVVRLFATLRNNTGENPFALLAVLSDLKEAFDNCCVSESGAVWNLTSLLSDGAKKVYEAYKANGMSIIAMLVMELERHSPTLSLKVS